MAFKNMVPERSSVTSCRMLTKSNECYSVMAWMYHAIFFCEVYIKIINKFRTELGEIIYRQRNENYHRNNILM